MKVFKLIITLILFFSFEADSYAQLDSFVNLLSKKTFSFPTEKKIKKEPIVKYSFDTGDLKTDSILTLWFNKPSYKNAADYYYQVIDSLASDQELINLTSHDSPVVQAYAAIALSYRDTLLLPKLLQKMLDANQLVHCDHGCLGSEVITASMLFNGLYRRNRELGIPTDAFIDRMDSIYFSNKNVPEMDISVKLLQLRSRSLNPVIETLAFKRKSLSAIRYLYDWYKGEYYVPLNKTCLALLDSNIVFYYPATRTFIDILIELNDKNTLSKLGNWLKLNREKWIGLYDIDKMLDKSHILRDSLGWNADRYPVTNNEVDFLLGDWVIISGMNINKLKTADTVILERKATQKINYQKLRFDMGNWLALYYYENTMDKKCKMVGTPVFDQGNLRICFETGNWDWYKITRKKNRLILIRE